MKNYTFKFKNLEIKGEGYNPEDALRSALEEKSVQELIGEAEFEEIKKNNEPLIIFDESKSNFFLDYIFAIMVIVLSFSLVSFLLIGGNRAVSILLLLFSSLSMFLISKLKSKS